MSKYACHSPLMGEYLHSLAILKLVYLVFTLEL